MEVTILYFAAARELCGLSSETLSIPGNSANTRDVLSKVCDLHPRFAPYAPQMSLALNDELLHAQVNLKQGDQLAILPPVAGGCPLPPANTGTALLPATAAEPTRGDVRSTPLSVDEAMAAVTHPGAGGLNIFVGLVRDNADGLAVARLDYEAHKTLAEAELRKTLAEVAAEIPGTRIHAQHRIGELRIGDAAVVIAASAPHRQQAFEACRNALDRIKERVPIWKKEWEPDGATHWVNLADPTP